MKQNLLKVLGNDVVDLTQAKLQSNWKRKGYLAKTCTLEEQHLIQNSEKSDSIFWMLWTMKEAAYKAVNRITAERSYQPLSFSCQQIKMTSTGATAVVGYDQFKLLVSTEINAKFIHSTAVSEPLIFKDLVSYISPYIADYVSQFNAGSTSYQLIKNKAGLPALVNRFTGKRHIATVSHHGRYLFIVYSDFHLLAD